MWVKMERDVEDTARSGSPKTHRCDENVVKVRNLVICRHGQSTRLIV